MLASIDAYDDGVGVPLGDCVHAGPEPEVGALQRDEHQRAEVVHAVQPAVVRRQQRQVAGEVIVARREGLLPALLPERAGQRPLALHLRRNAGGGGHGVLHRPGHGERHVQREGLGAAGARAQRRVHDECILGTQPHAGRGGAGGPDDCGDGGGRAARGDGHHRAGLPVSDGEVEERAVRGQRHPPPAAGAVLEQRAVQLELRRVRSGRSRRGGGCGSGGLNGPALDHGALLEGQPHRRQHPRAPRPGVRAAVGLAGTPPGFVEQDVLAVHGQVRAQQVAVVWCEGHRVERGHVVAQPDGAPEVVDGGSVSQRDGVHPPRRQRLEGRGSVRRRGVAERRQQSAQGGARAGHSRHARLQQAAASRAGWRRGWPVGGAGEQIRTRRPCAGSSVSQLVG